MGLLVAPWRLRGRKFDVIFVFQTSPVTSAIPALFLRWLKGAPLLLWVLDLWPESLAAVGAVTSPRLISWVGRIVKAIYRRSDRVLVQSRAFVPNILKYGGDSARIRYFPNWAEPVRQHHGDKGESLAAAPELEPYANTFNVMFAGNIGEAQDFPAILAAAALLRDEFPQLRWLIVGEGRAAVVVREEIKRLRLGDCFILLGRFPLERMPALFRGASAVLVSLRREAIFSMTIPGKLQSYLSAGVPILGMLDGEGARVIEESGAGVVVPAGESAQLAGAVRRMVGLSTTERMLMRKRGQAYCAREFDRSKLMSALEGWMDELSKHGMANSSAR